MGVVSGDGTYIYSCMVIGATSGKIQTIAFMFNSATGNKQTGIEMSTNNAVDCSIIYQPSSTLVLLAISYNTGTTELVSFTTSGATLAIVTNTARLRFVPTGFWQTGKTRMNIWGNDIWIVFPSYNTGNTLSSLFMTKVDDVAGMNWLTTEGCIAVHLRDTVALVPTCFTVYQIGSPGYGGDNVNS